MKKPIIKRTIIKKTIRNFIRNTHGAVTVMVTLLLIPALLMSGTTVDLARIYTGRSIIQDANQLAANAVLTQYDAMLQDIYGLYQVMNDDPVLEGMVDEYVQTAVFGAPGTESPAGEMGSFQLFSGSGLQPVTVTAAPGKNLSNPDVLRRQIEEYAKFRAPVIIVTQIMSALDSFDKLGADTEVIKQKMEIDDKIVKEYNMCQFLGIQR